MKILTVSELTQEIKSKLETHFFSLSVQGEITNLKVQTSGHIYFTLKDKESQISAVLFKGSTKNLSRLPKDGDQVIIQGEISVYSPRGTYQIIVRTLTYHGIGALLIEFHERKQRLSALGYFSQERKKKLPSFPKTVGVITSPTGAVIQDILQILQRRHSGFHLILYPVRVQGEGAKEEIAKAIYDCNHHKIADVLIVGRGGGSLEDLWAFNEEIVVQAIANSFIPIISAVGHETDFSLCDLAADVRAPTPSAAAEIVLSEKNQQEKFLMQTRRQIHEQVKGNLHRMKQQLSSLKKSPYLLSPYLLLSRRLQQLDENKLRLGLLIKASLQHKKSILQGLEKQKNALEPSTRIQTAKERLKALQKSSIFALQQALRTKKSLFTMPLMQKRLHLLFTQNLSQKQDNLQKLISHLSSIDPKNLLTKGYCILFSENRDSVILSCNQVEVAQDLCVLLQDGIINAKAKEVVYDPPKS
jgi:exodeoxyribonuclease VII large subunit